MRTRLRSCDAWHPDEPASMTTSWRTNGMGYRHIVPYCRICNRLRKRKDAKPVNPLRKWTPQPEMHVYRYNILPRLTWAPPQL